MFGCFSFLSVSISAPNRSRKLGSAASAGESTFTAAEPPVVSSTPQNTDPIPPLPSGRWITYGPSR